MTNLELEVEATARLVEFLDRVAVGAYEGEPEDWDSEARKLAESYDNRFSELDEDDRSFDVLLDAAALDIYEVVHRHASGLTVTMATVVVFSAGGPHIEATYADGPEVTIVGYWAGEEERSYVAAPAFVYAMDELLGLA